MVKILLTLKLDHLKGLSASSGPGRISHISPGGNATGVSVDLLHRLLGGREPGGARNGRIGVGRCSADPSRRLQG
jgi:hypothetical protein